VDGCQEEGTEAAVAPLVARPSPAGPSLGRPTSSATDGRVLERRTELLVVELVDLLESSSPSRHQTVNGRRPSIQPVALRHQTWTGRT
jgi:hypothetical protein